MVTADTSRTVITQTEIADELSDIGDLDSDDSAALAWAQERAAELIAETPFPDELREEILTAYDDLDDDPSVAVRSSADRRRPP